MRRERLVARPSPDPRHDYVVELRGEPMPGTRLALRLVPDRLVLDPASLVAYLTELGAEDPAGGPEAMALAVLDDLNNELVPRWVEVAVERAIPLPHRVVVEDRQPSWDNPALIARLTPL